MIVIHGVARYGKVDAVGDEYLVTRFHHVFGIPLFPIESEWITGRDCTGVYGRACRLSVRSVVAAYLRTWGLLLAALFGVLALDGAPELLIPVVALLTFVGASVATREMREPRELRRIELQRPVLGLALDPLRLPRDTAEVFIATVEQRFDSLSQGRTVFDVARSGAATPAEAAHAFVLLRLVAGARCDNGSRDSWDAYLLSEYVLDRPLSPCVADGPFRGAPSPVAVPSRPLLESYLLRPQRWYGVTASIVACFAIGLMSPPSALNCFCADKSDIARTGVKKLAYESYPQWAARPSNVGRCPSTVELAEYGGSVKDPWGNPYLLRCEGLPSGAAGIAVWSTGEDKRDQWGAGDDIAAWAD